MVVGGEVCHSLPIAVDRLISCRSSVVDFPSLISSRIALMVALNCGLYFNSSGASAEVEKNGDMLESGRSRCLKYEIRCWSVNSYLSVS